MFAQNGIRKIFSSFFPNPQYSTVRFFKKIYRVVGLS